MQTTYKVWTRDVDGQQPARTYKTLAKAIARFEEMYGHPVESAIAEHFHMKATPPTIRALESLRAVSNYGCVVSWLRVGPAEVEEGTDPLDNMDDEQYADEMEQRGRSQQYLSIPHPCDHDSIPF